MKQVIIIPIKNKQLEKIVASPHITLVYPFSINKKKLLEYIKETINKTKKFKIILKGHQKSAKEYYLYLLISSGKRKVMSLYKKFNSGPLKGFKNPDMPKYIPHVSLGNFKTKKEFNEFKKEIEKKNLKITLEVDQILLGDVSNIGDITKNKLVNKKYFKLK
jgi:2'-5' RNA ligase